jgi:dTDP-4-dehydrorhamnose reductase
MSRRLLVTGGTGQVGAALIACGWPAGTEVIAPTRAELNLADPAAIARYLDGQTFDAIISSGAYTAVDKAESDVATAWLVNAVAPAVFASHAARHDIPIIQVSTDYVFDGAKPAPYLESDPVGPIGVYGASKEGGEQAVRTSRARHVILRTSWVVSPHGANFIKTMLRVGAERPLLRVVADQTGAPTVAGDLASAISVILGRLLSDPDAPTGTFHLSNSGETTWFGLASHVFAVAKELGRSQPALEPITTADYPTPARRPANSRLALDKLGAAFGILPRHWQDATAEVVRALLAARAD